MISFVRRPIVPLPPLVIGTNVSLQERSTAASVTFVSQQEVHPAP